MYVSTQTQTSILKFEEYGTEGDGIKAKNGWKQVPRKRQDDFEVSRKGVLVLQWLPVQFI